MKLQLTISNPHVEAWLERKAQATGRSPQEIFRDMAYQAMISEVGAIKPLRGMDDKWGESPREHI